MLTMTIGNEHCTIEDMLRWGKEHLLRYRVPDPARESEYLLAEILGCKMVDLYIRRGTDVRPEELDGFADVIERRSKREPSQYICGRVEFYGLEFKVTPDVLIPRAETELLVEEAIKEAKGENYGKKNTGFAGQRDKLIIDLCAGSGCVAISMSKEVQQARYHAIDISCSALKVAKENAAAHGVLDRIEFIRGDLFEPIRDRGLNGKIDLVVSNPPYISKKMISSLQPEVSSFEPRIAIYGGDDGLEFYRRIIADIPYYLKKGGCLIMEIGYGQAGAVKMILDESDCFWSVVVKKDYAGIERVIKAVRIS